MHTTVPERQVVLDTETTGFSEKPPISQGHYVIEIGGVELVHRKRGRRFQRYLKAPRASTEASLAVHGLTESFLEDKPTFSEVADDFLAFIEGAELIIHNAAFDVGFLETELARAGRTDQTSGAPLRLQTLCPRIIDTLRMARRTFPGRRNNLNALCERLGISTENRQKHGALLDAELLAEVYLKLTGGQASLGFEGRIHPSDEEVAGQDYRSRPSAPQSKLKPHPRPGEPTPTPSAQPEAAPRFRVIHANSTERAEHHACLALLRESSGGLSLWEQCFPNGTN